MYCMDHSFSTNAMPSCSSTSSRRCRNSTCSTMAWAPVCKPTVRTVIVPPTARHDCVRSTTPDRRRHADVDDAHAAIRSDAIIEEGGRCCHLRSPRIPAAEAIAFGSVLLRRPPGPPRHNPILPQFQSDVTSGSTPGGGGRSQRDRRSYNTSGDPFARSEHTATDDARTHQP